MNVFLSKLITFYNSAFVAVLLSFLVGYLSAFTTFSVYFKDSLKDLFCAWETQVYSVLNGVFAYFFLSLANVLDISIMNVTFNAHPCVLAVIVGVTGHKVLLSFFKSEDELDIVNNFNSFFGKIQSFLFHRYAIKRHQRIRVKVEGFMPNFPDEKLNELILSCQIIAKEINEADADAVISRIHEIISYDISGDNKAISVGTELSKYLGSDLIKQLVEKVSADDNLDNVKSLAANLLEKIKTFSEDDRGRII